MGRTMVEFSISNYGDLVEVKRGHLAADKVRTLTMQGVVDTGAARLVIPESVARELGLPVVEQTSVRFADHRRASRDVVSDAYVEMLGRSGTFKAVLEPNRPDALIGAIVLEDLDLLVDCTAQRLVPRDPNTTITEVE